MHVSQKRKPITQKKLNNLAKSSQRKEASKFNAARSTTARCLRRYTVQGSQWAVGSSGIITWNVVDWSIKLPNVDVKRILKKAFRIWAEVSPLVFHWVDPPTVADIAVKFVTGKVGG